MENQMENRIRNGNLDDKGDLGLGDTIAEMAARRVPLRLQLPP